ncbi:MAG: flagellar assembly protein FliH [Bacillota bacterium]|nr:flagellar assembly protein FliH [Bacillota bacterium]
MSKIIKSQWAQAIYDEQKIISIKVLESMKDSNALSEMNFHIAAKQKELLSEAYSQAEMIVKEAEFQAKSIRDQIMEEKSAWEQEKARLIENAKDEGFSQGFNDGVIQGHKEYHEKILFAQEVIHTSKKEYESHIAQADKTILKIGISAAEKILGQKLSESEDCFGAIVKRALKEARESREVQLHVHPCHFDFLLSRKEELAVIFPTETSIYIYPNDELTENSLFIESTNGRIDASIDSQLEELKRKLLELLEDES